MGGQDDHGRHDQSRSRAGATRAKRGSAAVDARLPGPSCRRGVPDPKTPAPFPHGADRLRREEKQRGGKDLILHAPPPRHFLETAEALNFRFDLDEFISADKILSRPTRDRKGARKSEKSDDGESEFDGANESDIVIP